jgi:hypothetical protein
MHNTAGAEYGRSAGLASFEQPFRLHRETKGYFGRPVENLKDIVAEQATELTLVSLFGNQFDPAVAGLTLGTDDIRLFHGQETTIRRALCSTG